MEPITQALAAATLARTGVSRMGRGAAWIVIAAGVAPDLDLLSSLGGADAYFRFHRTLLHSCVGAIGLAALIAVSATLTGRRMAKTAGALSFPRAFALSLMGVAMHIGLDLCDSSGVQVLWPFRVRWFAWNFSPKLELIAAGLLAITLLLPALLAMVSEEIGEREKDRPGARRWAIAALAVLGLYMTGRAALHRRAGDLLMSRSYHGATPLRADAFPALSPLEWRGVVATDNALVEIDVPMGAAAAFDPDRGVAHFKPEDSRPLDAAQSSRTARRFLTYARFPLARIEPEENGTRVEIRDLRFADDDKDRDNFIAVIDIDRGDRVLGEQIIYARDRRR
jgi:membrane-bound metal-dependent hydrolase YbcI (DUF457 family)